MWLIDRRQLSWTFSNLFSIVHRQQTEQLIQWQKQCKQ